MYQIAVAIESSLQNGEDRAEIIDSPQGIVIVVADGVGGQSGGGAAADLTRSLLREGIPRFTQEDWTDSFSWADLLTRTDQMIVSDPEAGMTTCVIIALPIDSPGSLFGASVGDSEAWVVTGDDWIELTEHQARLGKSFLGRGDAEGIAFIGELNTGSTLVVATDGLFKYADADKICAAARLEHLDEATRNLVELVRFPSGGLPDDIAVVLCRPA